MNLSFFDQFSDQYLQKDEGKGVFLAGITLGMLARGQVSKGDDIAKAPLFKQLNFGKMMLRDLKKHLSRVPELTRVYRVKGAGRLEHLAAEAGSLMLKSGIPELGVDGNFAFSVAFLNPWPYYAAIFEIDVAEEQVAMDTNEVNEDDE